MLLKVTTEDGVPPLNCWFGPRDAEKMITGWRTPISTVIMGIAVTAVSACTDMPAGTSPTTVATLVPTSVVLVSPTPEPPDTGLKRLATVEAAANEARVSPGYVWTQTCERFRSTQSGCQTGR